MENITIIYGEYKLTLTMLTSYTIKNKFEFDGTIIDLESLNNSVINKLLGQIVELESMSIAPISNETISELELNGKKDAVELRLRHNELFSIVDAFCFFREKRVKFETEEILKDLAMIKKITDFGKVVEEINDRNIEGKEKKV